MVYPGGKAGAGTYQRLINLMPPHHTFIDAYLGGGAITLAKRAAAMNIGIDLNPIVLAETSQRIYPGGRIVIPDDHRCTPDMTMPANTISNDDAHVPIVRTSDVISAQYQFIVTDAVRYLQSYPFHGDELVYCDPPYVMSTRKQQRAIYDFEYSDADHHALLNVLLGLPCMVMISGYFSELYADLLSDWHTTSFTVTTRGGTPAEEWLWMNYPEPTRLHDYSYLGEDFRQRERIKRKKTRWLNRLQTMNKLERQAILWAISESGLDGDHIAASDDGAPTSEMTMPTGAHRQIERCELTAISGDRRLDAGN